MLLKVLLSGLILFFLLFSACGHLFNIVSPGSAPSGTGFHYACNNGIAFSGFSQNQNEERCSFCDTGYYLANDTCKVIPSVAIFSPPERVMGDFTYNSCEDFLKDSDSLLANNLRFDGYKAHTARFFGRKATAGTDSYEFEDLAVSINGLNLDPAILPLVDVIIYDPDAGQPDSFFIEDLLITGGNKQWIGRGSSIIESLIGDDDFWSFDSDIPLNNVSADNCDEAGSSNFFDSGQLGNKTGLRSGPPSPCSSEARLICVALDN